MRAAIKKNERNLNRTDKWRKRTEIHLQKIEMTKLKKKEYKITFQRLTLHGAIEVRIRQNLLWKRVQQLKTLKYFDQSVKKF